MRDYSLPDAVGHPGVSGSASLVELDEPVDGAGLADLKAFDLPEPAFLIGSGGRLDRRPDPSEHSGGLSRLGRRCQPWQRSGSTWWAWVITLVDRSGHSPALLQRWYYRDDVTPAPTRPTSPSPNRWHLGWRDDAANGSQMTTSTGKHPTPRSGA
jgi:hypothetical protein